MKRIVAAIGDVVGFALGIVSIPVALFMGLLFTALPIVLVLWVLGVWPVENNTNESIIQPTPPWATTDCGRLQALVDEGTFGLACLGEVGTEEYENRRQMWLDLITEQDLSADEAIAGFYAWLANQGENCRIWTEIMISYAFCPQSTPALR